MMLPEKYAERIRASLADADSYMECMAQPPAKGARVNSLKISDEEFLSRGFLQTEGKVPWAEHGYYIADEKPGKSIYFHAGLFYVQEPSAMCAAPLLDAKPGERVLDLCSAPGGKGTQLAAAMRGAGILVLNEKIPSRAEVLSENVERMGIANAVVLCADPAALEERFCGYFDKILVDAPCSGEGMMRKEAAALAEWSEENVKMCAGRQRKILESAAKMLRPGGRLVYSTCTFSEEEDEENAAWLASRGFALLQEEKLWPHRVRGEGHFAALLQKDEGAECAGRIGKNPPADKKAAALWRTFAKENLLSLPEGGELLSFGDALYLVPEELFSLKGLKVLRAGIRLGTVKGDRFEPDHALAMAAGVRFASVCALTEEGAAAYLRGEEVASDGAKGWCAAERDGFALGLGKIAGGVMKNKYPKGLRVNRAAF